MGVQREITLHKKYSGKGLVLRLWVHVEELSKRGARGGVFGNVNKQRMISTKTRG